MTDPNSPVFEGSATGSSGLHALMCGVELAEARGRAEPDGTRQEDNYDDSSDDSSDDDGSTDGRDVVSQTCNQQRRQQESAVRRNDCSDSESDLYTMMDSQRNSNNERNSNEEASSDHSEINDPPVRNMVGFDGSRSVAFDAGYDSNGQYAPANLTSTEEVLLEEEQPLGEEPPNDNSNNNVNEEEDDDDDANAEAEEEPPNVPVPMDETTLKGLSVAQLKEELHIRNVTFPSKIKKAGLQDRLRQSLQFAVVAKRPKKGEKKKKKKSRQADDMSEFAPGAYWKVLKHKEEGVDEPVNAAFNGTSRAPTVPAEDASKPQAAKHDFSETFDRPTFTGTKRVPKRNMTGSIRKDRDGNVIYEDVLRERGGPKEEFLKKHKLDVNSHPAEFFEAFLPAHQNKYKNKSNVPCISVSAIQQHTNLKAVPSNAGTDECYKDWKPFSVKEIQQHLSLYMLNGISPSPSLDLKFDRDDEANYNKFVDAHMPNGLRRHRHFKAFLSAQDPRKDTPNRDTNPLFKLAPLINWINKVGAESWDLGMNLSVDEQTISFQGPHKDKQRVTYKAAGDGFQCDALCDRGFAYPLSLL